jgi:lysophospholipase L1-like esterase
VHSFARQQFEVRGSRVEPEIVALGNENISFPVDIPWPSQILVRAAPGGKADIEIAVVEEGTRRILLSRRLFRPADIALSMPPVKGNLEFVNRGDVRWTDPRVEHDLAVVPWLLGLTCILAITGWGTRRFSFPSGLDRSRPRTPFVGVFTAVVSTILSLACLEVGLRLFGDELPSPVSVERRDLGEYRADPRWQDSFRYGHRLAARLNTFCEWQEGDIVRMGFLPAGLVSHPAYHFPFVTDPDGFRNSTTAAPAAAVAVLGDSFTDAMTVPADLSWPLRLGGLLGVKVRNYGTAGFGPGQELEVLKEFVLARRPRRVVIGFFAGNDLQDAEHYGGAGGEGERIPAQGWKFKGVIARFDEFYLVSVYKAVVAVIRERLQDRADEGSSNSDYSGEDLNAPAVTQPSFDRGLFAIPVAGRTVRFAFMPPYLERLKLTREQLRSSRGWDVTCRLYREMNQLIRSQGGQLVVVFIPSKDQVYLPLLSSAFPPAELQKALRSCVGDRPANVRVAALLQNRLALNDLLREFCATEGIAFLDLTPVLQKTLASGRNTYFPDDSHWNAAGHEVAAKAIAGFMKD